MKRRDFMATGAMALASPYLTGTAFAAAGGRALPIPPLIDTGEAETSLLAQYGQTAFLDGLQTPTWGYGQAYLGPTLRMTRGALSRMRIINGLKFPITCHWHGLHVAGHLDGGPQGSIAPGADWAPQLPIDQPAATLWYHSHSHGVTSEQVYGGLAGMIQIEDPDAPDSGLPSDYGVDDIPLILQDRAFTDEGAFHYVKQGPALMHGFRADQIMVNGAIRPAASVPGGLVRLRLLNGSNARIYHLSFDDARVFHQVASDGGLLAAPVEMWTLSLAPAERAEIVVDFSDGAAVRLLSGPDMNDPMAGMMARMMGSIMGNGLPPSPPRADNAPKGVFEVMRFEPDSTRRTRHSTLPSTFAGAPSPDFGAPVREREFTLNMHGGGGGGGMGMGMGMGGAMGMMNINGQAFDPNRIDVQMRRGETELWRIKAPEMAHPFHIHGTQFRVLSHNGVGVNQATTGLKDVVVVNGEAEVLVQVNTTADANRPYMFHCHILEHEDAGMMGQFTVT